MSDWWRWLIFAGNVVLLADCRILYNGHAHWALQLVGVIWQVWLFARFMHREEVFILHLAHVEVYLWPALWKGTLWRNLLTAKLFSRFQKHHVWLHLLFADLEWMSLAVGFTPTLANQFTVQRFQACEFRLEYFVEGRVNFVWQITLSSPVLRHSDRHILQLHAHTKDLLAFLILLDMLLCRLY